jgi:hypothetical protein
VALQATAGTVESAFKTKTHIHSVTYALTTQLIPLLKRLRDLDTRLKNRMHVLGDGWQYYLNLQFRFQMLALGYAAVSQFYQALHDHPTGVLWDLTQNAGKQADSFRQKAETSINSARNVAQTLGKAQTRVEKMAQQSINASVMGERQ